MQTKVAQIQTWSFNFIWMWMCLAEGPTLHWVCSESDRDDSLGRGSGSKCHRSTETGSAAQDLENKPHMNLMSCDVINQMLIWQIITGKLMTCLDSSRENTQLLITLPTI